MAFLSYLVKIVLVLHTYIRKKDGKKLKCIFNSCSIFIMFFLKDNYISLSHNFNSEKDILFLTVTRIELLIVQKKGMKCIQGPKIGPTLKEEKKM
jgi:hypothetical protein